MNSLTNKKRSQNIKKVIYIGITLVLIAIVVARLKSNKETTQDKIYQYDKGQAINVGVDTITAQTLKNGIIYTGTFQSNKESKISTDIQGKINKVLVDVGSIVKRGQALVELDNSLLKLQLQSVDIQIEGLEADVDRYTILANADAIQRVQLEKASLGLKAAKIQKATILEQIKKTIIVAPFNGIVSAKLTEEGAFAAPGMPLLQIIDILNLKFIINIPESDLAKFKLNQEYVLAVDAYPELSLSGKVSMTGSQANMSNSFPIQFFVKNTPDLQIKSGMFGKVTSKNISNEKHIIIPASAIVGTTNQPQVYLVKDKKAALHNVLISNRLKNKVVVSNGLNEGDIIVINGFVNLFDGANVNIK